MSISTGTPETRTQHSRGLAGLSIFLAVGLPVALTILGIAAEGWDRIAWLGALLWGVVAASAMTGMIGLSRKMGITRLDIGELIGSIFAESGSKSARMTGTALHLANGALLAIAWAYTMALLNWPMTWFTGLIWGAFLSLLALLLISSLGAIHPTIRGREQDDPGPMGVHFGGMTPADLVLAHIVYGIVLGGLYQFWTLSA